MGQVIWIILELRVINNTSLNMHTYSRHRYNAAQYSTFFDTGMLRPMYTINHTMNSQKLPDTSSSAVNDGMSIVRFFFRENWLFYNFRAICIYIGMWIILLIGGP